MQKHPLLISLFTSLGAYWQHDGNTKRPHAILTSGKHSDGYLNCTAIVQHVATLETVCLALTEKISTLPCSPHWVFGSPMGSITLAAFLAHALRNCRAGFTEADGDRLIVKRFDVSPGELVLVADDVFTTGGTAQKTIQALEAVDADVLPYVCMIANRSGSPKLGERTIVSLIEPQFSTWPAETCPLCQAESEALRPKGNWAKLTGTT